jgi:hypothetical protein
MQLSCTPRAGKCVTTLSQNVAPCDGVTITHVHNTFSDPVALRQRLANGPARPAVQPGQGPRHSRAPSARPGLRDAAAQARHPHRGSATRLLTDGFAKLPPTARPERCWHCWSRRILPSPTALSGCPECPARSDPAPRRPRSCPLTQCCSWCTCAAALARIPLDGRPLPRCSPRLLNFLPAASTSRSDYCR